MFEKTVKPTTSLLVILCHFAFNACVAADDWPQWRGPNRDGRWHERGLIKTFPDSGLQPRWKVEIGPGYSGPTVVDQRVYLTDRQTEPEQAERVLCFDAADGQLLWQHRYLCEYRISYEAGPRAAVTVDDGQAFALGAMGHLHCLNAQNGEVLWKRDLNSEFQIQRNDRSESRMPIWGIAAAPLIHDDVVILHIGGRDGACVVALQRSDGSEVWRALDDRAQYTAPIVVRQAGQDVVVVWTGDSVAGLDPRSGKVHWRHVMTPINLPIGVATPIAHDGHVFVTSFYDGALMLKLLEDRLAVDEVWRARGRSEKDTDALHSIISTPIWLGDHIYGVDSYGELRCLEAATGKRVWEDKTATPRARWSTIHFVQNDDRTWMFNERGELIIAKLSPAGFQEISRAKLIEPTRLQLNRRDGVCWSHPAFAGGHVFARSDEVLVCASLLAGEQ